MVAPTCPCAAPSRRQKPEAESALRTTLVRAMTRLRASKLVKDQRASKVALERLVREDVETGRIVRTTPAEIAPADISAAAAAAVACHCRADGRRCNIDCLSPDVASLGRSFP